MNIETYLVLFSAILTVAVLYSCVGHGGASGYIAVLALFSVVPEVFKPTALLLNIMVASVAAYSFRRAGHFSWGLFWPFAATSIPFSFLGGYLSLPQHLYRPLVGMVLLASACRLLVHKEPDVGSLRRPPLTAALLLGAVLGLLSGLTGVGGGIFLSPLLMLLRWGRAREVSGVAALFILVNSCAGLLGHASSLQLVPGFAPLLAVAALLGGCVGSFLGSSFLPVRRVVKALSLVLTVAGLKMLLV
ncbi:sulfite exporter TauE/SafE family protein [Citrifermentans bremense]|uniref:sulfite exporter TauE/SafE family protein n=1 Tax=Citrifermentans bremense TaxID=60035 RepID=UPI000426BD50|nr:sulfite exporter TauE/SafE family protein [Citrifermentans bremense]